MNVAPNGDPPAAMAQTVPLSSPVSSFVRSRIQRALVERLRYRYVHPQVLPEGEGWKIVSPCCSRRVDRDGGIVDIAWLQPLDARRWRLHAREHGLAQWRSVAEGPLHVLLEHLNHDPQHEFWI
jgi:hypothetical protein